jgi:rare lipoprotein A
MKKVLFTVVLLFLLSSFTKDASCLTGIATYYHNKYEGRLTSTDEVFHQRGYTAASNFFPLHTVVKVTSLLNGKFVIVRINDRMAKWTETRGRIIDLTASAAKQLGFYGKGMTRVQVVKFNPEDTLPKIFDKAPISNIDTTIEDRSADYI